MARSLSSIQQVTKLIIDQKPWDDDPRVHRLPWNEIDYQSIQQKPLTIGLLLDDGVVKIHPPIERVVRAAAEKLAAVGHSIVPWSSDGHAECIRVMVSVDNSHRDYNLDVVLGSVLHRRRRRRYQTRRHRRRRAIPTACRSSRIKRLGNISLRLLGSQSREAGSSESISEEVAVD